MLLGALLRKWTQRLRLFIGFWACLGGHLRLVYTVLQKMIPSHPGALGRGSFTPDHALVEINLCCVHGKAKVLLNMSPPLLLMMLTRCEFSPVL